MQQTYPTEAIVLDRQIFREFDSRIVVYSSDHGLLDLVARGTKRFKSKLSGHIEPITRSKIMIAKGKQLDYLASAVNQDSYSQLKSNYESLVDCGRALRMTAKKLEAGISDERIFNLLRDYLELLNKKCDSPEKSLFYLVFFVLKFADLLGYGMQLKNCSCSGLDSSVNIYLSYDNCSLACDRCKTSSKHKEKINKKELDILRKMMTTGINEPVRESLSRNEIQKLEKISQYYIKYSMDYEF